MTMMEGIRDEITGHITGVHTALHEQNLRLAEQCHYLSQLVEHTTREVAQHEYVTRSGSVQLGATDVTGDLQVGPVPGGHSWLWSMVAVTGGASGPCAVYFDAIAPSNLCYFIPNAQIFSDTGLQIYVRERRSLIFHFYNQPNSQLCTAQIQAMDLSDYPRERARTGGD